MTQLADLFPEESKAYAAYQDLAAEVAAGEIPECRPWMRCEADMSGQANVRAIREAMARKAIGLAVDTFIEAEKPLPINVNAELVVRVGTSEVRLTPLQGLGFAEQLARAGFRRAITEEILAAAPDKAAPDAP